MNLAQLRVQQIPVESEPRAAAPFHLLVKPIGAGCNLGCRYCYYPQRQQERTRKMDDDLLAEFIRGYIAAQPRYSRGSTSSGRVVSRCWRGSVFTSGRWRCNAATRRRACGSATACRPTVPC